MTHPLYSPTLEVNDQPIAYIPESLSFKFGDGNKIVKALCAGGNSIETVISEDATTKKSMVKFKVADTGEYVTLTRGWSTNINGNTIRLSQGEITVSFRQMVVTNEPEFMTGSNGEVDLEFEGMPVL